MQIGITELILVFVVALFSVGPDRLPAYVKKLGEAVSVFKRYSEEATREIKESVVEPLEEMQAPLREAVQPLEELDKAVRENAKEVKESFAGIGKPKKPVPAEAEADEPAPTEAEDSSHPKESTAADEAAS